MNFDFQRIIEPLLSYGVLGVIGIVFLYNQIKNQEKSSAHFDKLFDAMTTSKDQSLDDIKKAVLSVSESLQSHNINSQKMIGEVKLDLQKLLEIRTTSKKEFEEYMEDHQKILSDLQTYNTFIHMELVKLKELSLSLRYGEEQIIENLIKRGKLERMDVNELMATMAESELRSEIPKVTYNQVTRRIREIDEETTEQSVSEEV